MKHFPTPPFPRQSQSFPGVTSRMDPRPDHGEDSYEGMGRPGQPAELASAYVMLASDTSSYTSGARITIAGGQAVV